MIVLVSLTRWQLKDYIGKIQCNILNLIYIYTDDETLIISLGNVLMFLTGSDEMLPTGFEQKITINFTTEKRLPFANTCALNLILPTGTHQRHLRQ